MYVLEDLALYCVSWGNTRYLKVHCTGHAFIEGILHQVISLGYVHESAAKPTTVLHVLG